MSPAFDERGIQKRSYYLGNRDNYHRKKDKKLFKSHNLVLLTMFKPRMESIASVKQYNSLSTTPFDVWYAEHFPDWLFKQLPC